MNLVAQDIVTCTGIIWMDNPNYGTCFNDLKEIPPRKICERPKIEKRKIATCKSKSYECCYFFGHSGLIRRVKTLSMGISEEIDDAKIASEKKRRSQY